MSFIDEIKARARKNIKTIVLPEGEDRRVLEAAATTIKEGNAKVVILGKEADIKELGKDLDLSAATLIDPAKSDKLDAYIDKLYADVTSLFQLDQIEVKAGKRVTFGGLPGEAKTLLITIPCVWVVIGGYSLWAKRKDRKKKAKTQ